MDSEDPDAAYKWDASAFCDDCGELGSYELGDGEFICEECLRLIEASIT